jgi:hypothetical protein
MANDDETRFAHAQMLKLESSLRVERQTLGMVGSFLDVVRVIGRQTQNRGALAEIGRATRGTPVEKAAVSAITLGDFWESTPGSDLAKAWLASIAEISVLDLIARFALPLPADVNRLVVASGATASVVAEGFPKAVTKLSLSSPSVDRIKTAAIIVMSDELSRATSGAADRLFRAELENAIVSAFNTAALQQFAITPIPETGTALGDLKAGIAAAAPSFHYVVAARRDVTRKLAFDSEGRMGPGGGEFLPGIWIVPVDDDNDSSGKQMTVIPADRVGMIDHGLQVRNASEADIELSDTPSSPGQMTSLWTTNSHAILCERSFRLIPQANAVEVG